MSDDPSPQRESTEVADNGDGAESVAAAVATNSEASTRQLAPVAADGEAPTDAYEDWEDWDEEWEQEWEHPEEEATESPVAATEASAPTPSAALPATASSDGGPPPTVDDATTAPSDEDAPGREMDFMDHLDELRTRIIRCVLYAAIGFSLTWHFYDRPLHVFHLGTIPPIWDILLGPVVRHLDAAKIPTVFMNPIEPLLVRLQVSVVAGLVVMSPLVFYEVWAFVAPGLLPKEKRYLGPIIPTSFVLFWSGVLLCYKIIPLIFIFMLRFAPHDAQVFNFVKWYIVFMAKVCLAMGLVFQMPIVFWVLAQLGLVTSGFLIAQWRVAVVAIFCAAAIITPTPDPLNMTLVAAPICVLYFGSIIVVRMVERGQRKTDSAS